MQDQNSDVLTLNLYAFPFHLCDSKPGVYLEVEMEILLKPSTDILHNYQGHGTTRKD